MWNAHASQLSELLAWLTDDSWSLEFSQRSGGAGRWMSLQGFLFDTIPNDAGPGAVLRGP